jgi:hypothetical protein
MPAENNRALDRRRSKWWQVRQILAWAVMCITAAVVYAMSTVFGGVAQAICGTLFFLAAAMMIRWPRRVGTAIKTRAGFWRCLRLGTEAAVIVGAIILFDRALCPEVAFNFARGEGIVRAAESGQFVESPPGVLVLDSQFAGAAVGGRIYVTRLPAGRLYFFKTKDCMMRLNKFAGYVYSTAPNPKLIATDHNDSFALEVNFLGSWQPGAPLLLPVSVERTSSDHWLHVLGP